MTIESIVNQALDQIGYARHVGNIMEGSQAARVALDLWGQTRDSLLASMEPDWARKDAKLSVLKSAPNIVGPTAQYDLIPWSDIYPPLPWLYEYSTPTDLVKPLQIKPSQAFIPVWRPRAQPYRYIIDATAGTCLSNTPDAILTYIYQVLDPDLWHEDFRDGMVQMLAQKMQAAFAKGAPMKEREDADAS